MLYVPPVEQRNAALEQEVVLRTRAELNLLRSNRDLEEYVYAAAHDLTAPLRRVVAFLSLLEREYDGTLDKKAKDYIVAASRSAGQMQDLIDDLLTLARVDSNREPLAPVDCNVVFDRAVALLEHAIVEASATVTRDSLPTVMGVEGQLVQVLQNLIDNALKYRSKQSPRIHVTATKLDGQWEMCVTDNGIGLDPCRLLLRCRLASALTSVLPPVPSILGRNPDRVAVNKPHRVSHIVHLALPCNGKPSTPIAGRPGELSASQTSTKMIPPRVV